MKTEITTQTYRHIIDDYRFTFHPLFEGKTGLLGIEIYRKIGLFNKWKWIRIYFGHSTPIEKAIEFYNKQVKSETK
jgi:hypothetical protein